MDVLNRIINQNSNVVLTDANIVDIVKYYSMIEDEFQRAGYIRIIIESLNGKIINPDTFLTIAISEIDNYEQVILVALALRFGANPNLYVVYKNVGIVHIMVYTVMFLRGRVENSLIEYILCVENLLGSNPASFATKVSDRRNKNYNTSLIDSAVENDKTTVSQWLDSQGFESFIDMSYVKSLPFEDQVAIGAMVDNPEIAFPQGIESKVITEIYDEDGILISDEKIEDPLMPDLATLIIYNSYNVAKYTSFPMTMFAGECMELKICLKSASIEIFKELFNRGYKFTYYSLNRLLILFKDTVNISNNEKYFVNRVKYQIYLAILEYIISKGVEMDKEQLTLLSSFANEHLDLIQTLYSQPLWVKSCSSSRNIPLPEMVKNLAFSLNIDINREKPQICSDLETVANRNPDTFIENVIERQKSRAAVELKNTSEYMLSKNNIMCKNPALIDKNPFEYNDSSLVYYNDKYNNTWCFTADDFENLLSNPVNPYSNEKLPSYVINKMNNSLQTFKILGVAPNQIIPASQALTHLNKPDVISDKHTKFINDTVIRLAQTRGFFESEIKGFGFRKMNRILSEINMEQDYLMYLTESHRFATFCRVIYYKFKEDPDSIDFILNLFGM